MGKINKKLIFLNNNCVLDKAKMNRRLFISISELDEGNIIYTSKAIAESYNKELSYFLKYNLFIN